LLRGLQVGMHAVYVHSGPHTNITAGIWYMNLALKC